MLFNGTANIKINNGCNDIYYISYLMKQKMFMKIS